MASPRSVAPLQRSLLADSIDQLDSAFESASRRTGVIERNLLLVDQPVRVQFAGPALVPRVEPALTHLAAPRGGDHAPALTVRVWDAASTGTRPVPLPSAALREAESGPRFHTEREGVVLHAADATLSAVDTAGGTALHYVPDADRVRWYQTAAPLKEIVQAWARSRSLHLVHAAAVGRPDGGVLLAGNAGSGKSTTSLVCLRAGLEYAGDDYVLVDVERPFIHSLYSSAKLEWDHLDRHPGLLAPTNTRADPKALGFLGRDTPERIAPGFPLLAVLLPTITGRDDTKVVAIAGGRALLALAPSTLLQLPGGSRDALSALSQLVTQVPAFRLELGRDLAMVPGAIDALLADLLGDR